MSQDKGSYNPLDKTNLGESVANALLKQPVERLPNPRGRDNLFYGAGIYALYYLGERRPFLAYEPIAALNRDNRFEQPIYVGRAVPKGARKGGFGVVDSSTETVLFDRLQNHARSLSQATNLDLEDFRCRKLVVDDIWIPLGEALLIARTRPIWNLLIDGFGNHDPGGGRYEQSPSRWDTLHPGRSCVNKLRGTPPDEAELLELIRRSLRGEEVPTLTPEEAVLADSNDDEGSTT